MNWMYVEERGVWALAQTPLSLLLVGRPVLKWLYGDLELT